MRKKIILAGYFIEAAELCEKCGYEVVGYTDFKSQNTKYEYLGTDEEFIKCSDKKIPIFIVPDNVFARDKLYHLYKSKNFMIETVISPTATLSPSAVIGEGSVICDGCNISSEVTIGKCARINTMANCMHNAEIGDFCIIAPSAVLLGHVRVLNKAYVGANATILPNISIWGGVVGAGAVVTKNFENMTVAGVPAIRLT